MLDTFLAQLPDNRKMKPCHNAGKAKSWVLEVTTKE